MASKIVPKNIGNQMYNFFILSSPPEFGIISAIILPVDFSSLYEIDITTEVESNDCALLP